MIITVGTIVSDSSNRTFILDEPLGFGGFGNVYKAHCEQDGSVVAVKVLQNTFDSDEMYLSFQKEANQASLLNSENVIKYLYIHDGKVFPEYPPYIIMEYTDGGTLRDIIKQRAGRPFDIETLKCAYLQLARGMKCISEHLVHRDIKPENILNFDGILKITDFGLSKISGESTKTMTFKNGGTPLYVAPEAWNNDRNTIQMDIYSMGIVFYELAALSYPYELPARMDFADIREMHLYSPVINPTSKNRNLPPNLVSVIIRMLEKPTQKRFHSWDEIIRALDAEIPPKDNLSDIVNKAVSLRNEKDLKQQQQQLEKKKAEEKHDEHVKLSYAQFKNTVLVPIRNFIERFNMQYSRDNGATITEAEPSFSSHFSTKIKPPSGNDITITGEILFKEQFRKQVRSFPGERPVTVNYIPQCENRNVILWCQIADRNNLGFNLLLLESKDSMYGDWFILENSMSGLSRENRPSPFGFKLSELPKEINYIRALHVYNLELMPFTEEKLLEYIAVRL